MNLLITGSNGQLGLSLRRFLANYRNHKFENVFYTDVCVLNKETKDAINKMFPEEFKDNLFLSKTLDITNKEEINNFVKNNKIDVIVNCAAYTDVDNAEIKYEDAFKLNAIAPKFLAEVSKENKCKLIHISTDYVFDGNSTEPLKESDNKNPQSMYGETKSIGENFIINSECDYIIIRTQWLFSEFGKNFLKTIMKMVNEGKKFKVVYDQIGSPTYAYDLATFIYYVSDKSNEIYHFSNNGICSWYDFAYEIKKQMNIVNTSFIEPCLTEEYETKAKRPKNTVFNKNKSKEIIPIIRHWIEAIYACMINLNKL